MIQTSQNFHSAYSYVGHASAIEQGFMDMGRGNQKMMVIKRPMYGAWCEHSIRGCSLIIAV
jgi:hypothetical protein